MDDDCASATHSRSPRWIVTSPTLSDPTGRRPGRHRLRRRWPYRHRRPAAAGQLGGLSRLGSRCRGQTAITHDPAGAVEVTSFYCVEGAEYRTFNECPKKNQLSFELLEIEIKLFPCHGTPQSFAYYIAAETTADQYRSGHRIRRPSNDEDEVEKYSSGRNRV